MESDSLLFCVFASVLLRGQVCLILQIRPILTKYAYMHIGLTTVDIINFL